MTASSGTTKTKKPAAPTRDWNKEMATWPIEKDEEKPKKRVRHLLCDACYPVGYTGSAMTVCGGMSRVTNAKVVDDLPNPDRCETCAVIAHRRPNAPCPNADCPRRPPKRAPHRPWWRRLFN